MQAANAIRLRDIGINPKLPGVVGNCAEKLGCDAGISLKDLSSIGGTAFNSADQIVRRFDAALRKGKTLNHLYDHLSAVEKSKVDRSTLIAAVTDYLVSQIDPRTIA